MILRTIVLAVVSGLCVAATAPAADSIWGVPVDGLICRLSLVNDALVEGEYLTVAVELTFDPAAFGASAKFLNRERQLERYAVHLRDVDTGTERTRRFSYWGPPAFGSCDGVYAFAPLERPLPSDTLTVPLFKPGSDNAGPGRYEVWVTYENDGRTGIRPDPADAYGDVFWTGTIASSSVPLTVAKRPPEEVVLYTNAGICLNGYMENLYGHWSWSWDPSDSVEIRYVPRPGHGVGRTMCAWVERANGDSVWLSSGKGGAVMERSIPRSEGNSLAYPEGETLKVTLTISEAAVWHRFGPATGDPDLYRVLFTRTFEGIPGVTPSCADRVRNVWEPPSSRRRR